MRETIIQFGGGNFLRGFADYFIHVLNEKGLYDGKVVILQSHTKGASEQLNAQNGVYNLFLRGIQNGEAVCERTEIHSVSRALNPDEDFGSFLALAHNPDFRFVISNTTEAGIRFDERCKFSDTAPYAFPAKLTRLLYERFTAKLPGFIMLACELIDNNGGELKECVLKYADLWGLGDKFKNWLVSENSFCNTLVDRIVSGFPHDEAKALCGQIGYEDKLLDTAEIFHLWVIEGNFENELPLQTAGFNVIWTDSAAPYKKRKVRVLNGAHTSMVFPALLAGIETVGDCLKDEQISAFLNRCLFSYILPVIGENEENISFAGSVLERFANPYIHHQLKSIALNSVSKFKVRVLPTALEYREKHGVFPKIFIFSLAAMIEYYKYNEVSDDKYALEFIKQNSLSEILCNKELWNTDLSAELCVLEECTRRINSDGIREALRWILS